MNRRINIEPFEGNWVSSPTLNRGDELLVLQERGKHARIYYTYSELKDLLSSDAIRANSKMRVFRKFIELVDDHYANKHSCCKTGVKYGLF